MDARFRALSGPAKDGCALVVASFPGYHEIDALFLGGGGVLINNHTTKVTRVVEADGSIWEPNDPEPNTKLYDYEDYRHATLWVKTAIIQQIAGNN